MESVLVKLTIDRETLNNYLGNTPNVTIENGVSELLDSIFSEISYYCDRCGTSNCEKTEIIGQFELKGESGND